MVCPLGFHTTRVRVSVFWRAASLRPPASQETKETKGRKSVRKIRSQKRVIDDSEALETGIGIEGDEDEKGTFLDASIPKT